MKININYIFLLIFISENRKQTIAKSFIIGTALFNYTENQNKNSLETKAQIEIINLSK